MARRMIDTCLLGYFVFQIPSTIFFDSQAVYPASWYPSFLKSMRDNYIHDFKDVFLANAWSNPWYLAICMVEHYIEMPFFFFAAYAYYKGALQVPSVLLPSLIYSVHTLTAILGVWFMALLSDFSQYSPPAPATLGDRLKLCGAYLPFVIFCFICMIDSLMLLNAAPRPSRSAAKQD